MHVLSDIVSTHFEWILALGLFIIVGKHNYNHHLPINALIHIIKGRY